MAEPLTRTETFTAGGTLFYLELAFDVAPWGPMSVTENGVPQAVKNYHTETFDSTSWFWQPNDFRIFKIPAVAGGTVVVVRYQPAASNIVVATAPDAIAAEQAVNDPSGIPDPDSPDTSFNYTPLTPSGIYAGTVDQPSVTDYTTATRVTAGALHVKSVSPLVVKFTTWTPGLECGQNLSIEWPQYDLTGTFCITEITKVADEADWGHLSVFERTITAAWIQTTVEQDPPDTSEITTSTSTRYPVQPYAYPASLAQRAAVQPDPSQWERAILVIGPGAAGFAAGNTIDASYPIRHTGTLFEVTINSPHPPVNQKLVVDLLVGSLSLFSGATKPTLNPGDTDLIVYSRFRGYPALVRMDKNELLTVDAVYVAGSGAVTVARDVTVTVEWYF